MSSKRPDPEKDFSAFVESVAADFEKELRAHPEPEYWIVKAAAQLERFVQIKAPAVLIENARLRLVKHVLALPPYTDKEPSE